MGLRRVENPWAGIEEYHCFGCDPDNPIGLRMKFGLDGDVVRATWHPRPEFQGYPGVLHGGIQATLADEIGGWCVSVVLGTAGVTRALSVDYRTPARLEDGPFELSARITSSDAKTATIEVSLSDAGGQVCSVATCEYAVFSEAVARRKFHYPGREAFVSVE